MEWTRDVQDALAAPFPEDEIEFLPRAATNGRALALAHIDARTVMRRLDAVVGPDGWSFDFDVLSPDCKKIKGKLTVLGVTKCDAGEASTEDEPLKSAVSDALKRCAVHFGIGRFLYYLPQLWVNYDAAKRRFSETPRLPAGALEKALALCGYRGGAAPAGPERRPETPVLQVRDRTPQLKVDVPAPRTPSAPSEAPAAAPASGSAMTCASAGCGKPLTKGQHDVSMRAFGQPLCPACQRQQARAA
jgi:hypothetical protein